MDRIKLVTCLLVVGLGASVAASRFEAELDRAVAGVRSADYGVAMRSVAAVMFEAAQLGKIQNASAVLGTPQPFLNAEEIGPALDEIRRQMRAKNYEEAYRGTSHVGMSLARLHSGPGLGAESLMGLAHAAREAYHAQRWAEAGVMAERVLGTTPRMHELSGAARHSAHTVLGLLALREEDRGRAGEHLLKSVREAQDASWGIPNYLLAEKLLAAGERKVVLEYVRLVAKTEFRHPRTREIVTKYWREMEAGTAKDFAPLSRGLLR